MTDRTSLWGPELEQYSRTFNPQLLPDMPNRDIAYFYNEHKVLPLTSVHNSLCRSDPRTDALGFTGIKLTNMIEMLQKYLAASQHTNVFKNYYGFLCVRNLIHITCLGVLRETNTLDRIVESLHPKADWSSMAQTVAFAALDTAADALRNDSLLLEFYRIFTRSCFVLDSATGVANISALARILWDDRGSFLTLCLRGHLPGCTLLLTAIMRLLPTGSQEERWQILPRVCILVDDKNTTSPTIDKFVNQEDTNTIAKAYFGLLVLWRQDRLSAKSASIRLMTQLAGFVINKLARDPSVATQDLMDIVSTSVQFFWLLLEQRGQVSSAEHSEMKDYANAIYISLEFMLKECGPRRDERYKFAQLIADGEIASLAGRIVLSAATEISTSQREIRQDPTLERLVGLKDVFAAAASTAPELFHESSIEWNKVSAHGGVLTELKLIGLEGEASETAHYVAGILNTWSQYGRSLKFDIPPEACWYPRCIGPATFKKMLKVRHTCGRCNVVAYCDARCQRAHWDLATTDSHRLACHRPHAMVFKK
ncbi:hypothetical protein FRC07_004671 [Ceratobasidium sp. 392]|nr:hypothetical protein FRC07_004671 [Ceratobasidium sp. 392]